LYICSVIKNKDKMKTTTLRNGATVLDKYYVNIKQAERGQHNLMRDFGQDSFIRNFGGRIFWVVIKE